MSRTGPTGLPLQSAVGDGTIFRDSVRIPTVGAMHLRRARSSTSCGASAEANPEAPAIDDGDTTLSYSELLDEIALGARWAR